MNTRTSWLLRIATVITLFFAVFGATALPAEAASVSGGSAQATGYYRGGALTSYGSVYSNGSSCVHAEVKLALKNVNDYTWTEARACNGGSKSWNKSHRGPILSTFPASSVQGVYVRVCRERSGLPDDCGSYQYIGRV